MITDDHTFTGVTITVQFDKSTVATLVVALLTLNAHQFVTVDAVNVHAVGYVKLKLVGLSVTVWAHLFTVNDTVFVHVL